MASGTRKYSTYDIYIYIYMQRKGRVICVTDVMCESYRNEVWVQYEGHNDGGSLNKGSIKALKNSF